jgi:serine/threonine protein kinase
MISERDEAFFKNYNLQYLDTIGAGGYGSVYLIYDPRYNQEFAVKVIDQKKFRQNEINCMIELYDPNIVSLYKYYFYDGFVYLVMEYCPYSVEQLIKPSGIKCRQTLLKCAYDVLKAINACHFYNIAHYDIKPSNFLLDKNGRIKVADFGLSTLQINRELSNFYVGSLAFMAPEIVLRKPHDPFKADVWSLGVTLFMLATGQLPWNTKSKETIIHSVLEGEYNIDLIRDTRYSKLIAACLCVNPKDRPSVEELMNFPVFKTLSKNPKAKRSQSTVMNGKIIFKPCTLRQSLKQSLSSSHFCSLSRKFCGL